MELFILLSHFVCRAEYPGKVITQGDSAFCSQPADLDRITPCYQEEADTRIFLHAADGVIEGYKNILVCTVDSDVVVLAVGHAKKLGCDSLWVLYGSGKHMRYINATAISHSLGSEKSSAMLAFHGFTGSDTTSKFAGKGKVLAWAAWKAYDDVTPAFQVLSRPSKVNDIKEVMPSLERFVISLYDHCSSEDDINIARQKMFAQKNRELDHIPPFQNALLQHVLITAYQAGNIWGRSLEKQPELPSPCEYGWMKNDEGKWIPCWITIPPVSETSREILKCNCTKTCSRRCVSKQTCPVLLFASAKDVNSEI